MLTVSGTNVNIAALPHRDIENRAGSRWHAAHGWPAVLIDNAQGGALFVFGAFARFSPDSARTKIPIAKMAATQKINRAALDIFILLILFYAPAFRDFLVSNRS